MNLYEIEKEYIDLLTVAEHVYTTGVPEDITAFEEAVIVNQDNFKNKALSYSKLLRNLETDVDAIKGEIARLQKIQEVKTKTIDLLETKLVNAMQAFSTPELDFSTFKLRVTKTQIIEIDEDAKIPTSFMTVKTTSAPNKRALRQAIEAGKEIYGVRLKDNFHLKR